MFPHFNRAVRTIKPTTVRLESRKSRFVVEKHETAQDTKIGKNHPLSSSETYRSLLIRGLYTYTQHRCLREHSLPSHILLAPFGFLWLLSTWSKCRRYEGTWPQKLSYGALQSSSFPPIRHKLEQSVQPPLYLSVAWEVSTPSSIVNWTREAVDTARDWQLQPSLNYSVVPYIWSKPQSELSWKFFESIGVQWEARRKNFTDLMVGKRETSQILWWTLSTQLALRRHLSNVRNEEHPKEEAENQYSPWFFPLDGESGFH